MSRQPITELVDQLRESRISRRAFASGAAAAGISASAAGMLSRHASAQDASPEATPGASPVASPVAGEATRSINREEFNAALREEFQFEQPGSTGGQVIYVNTNDLDTLNPTLVQDVYSAIITGLVFEGLVGSSPIDGAIVPALADYWDIAADGVTYTFHLNPNAKWHDGQPVIADDVIFTFDSVIAEESLSVRRSGVVGALKSHRKIDDHTVELVAVDKLANFVNATAGQFAIVPKHIWEGLPFGDWGTAPGSTGQDPTQVVGSGPFTFVEWIRNDHVTVARNPDYWDTQNAVVIDQFIFRVVADPASATQTLITAESDILDIPVAQTASLRASNPELNIVDFDTFSFTYYEFNLDPAKALPFMDVKVRQALMYALDRDLVVETVYQSLATKADGTQPVLSIAYAPDRINTIYTYDPAKSNALLDEAGWVDSDGDGIREKDGAKFSFEFLYSEGSTVNEQLIPYIQQVWREVGVEMIPVSQPFPTLVDNQVNGTFAASLIGFNWDVFGSQGDMYRCDAVPPAAFNDMHYCNEEYDRLDALQLRELDQQKRIDILIEQTNIINDDQANSVLVFGKNVVGSQPRVHNFYPNGYSTFWAIPYVWVEQ